jgi:hypothetical protein
MKNQRISIIIASAILVAPHLNAGVADWISDNLPKSLQVSQEYRDEVRHIQEKTGNPNIPIIFINSHSNTQRASVRNFGIGAGQFAIMAINQKNFSTSNPDDNIAALAHEAVHIDRNHGGPQGTLFLGVNAALLAYSSCKSESSFTMAKAMIGLALGVALTSLTRDYMPQNDLSLTDEIEAEAGSFEKLKQLGYCKALEHQYQTYKNYEKSYSKDTRILGPNYPTLGEYIAWSEKACKECNKGINPAERPDSPNLTRNGSAS